MTKWVPKSEGREREDTRGVSSGSQSKAVAGARATQANLHTIFRICLKTKDYTSWSQLGSEHVLGLRQAAGAVQAHLGVDGAEGLEHADAPKPLVDRTQLEGPARCGGERGVPRAGGWGQGVV